MYSTSRSCHGETTRPYPRPYQCPDVCILSCLWAQVEDTNTSFLCAELHSIGWSVKRVAMVPDDMDSIANEVRMRVCVPEFHSLSSGPVFA
mmetsp:Transcript_5869/g.17975  ORF Transcript_5869/g.17975 Transcript_5869/m.17975 type:complete len:91 (-) Transcript_5869:735-1007(-)